MIFQKANGTLASVHNHNVVISLRNSSARTEQVRTVGSDVAGGLRVFILKFTFLKQGGGGIPRTAQRLPSCFQRKLEKNNPVNPGALMTV